jgi:hypothetical protein
VLNPPVADLPKPPPGRRPAPIPAAVAELWELILAYFKQETTEPLKALGRVIAFGIAGSLLIGTGVVFVAIGALRLLQEETDAFEGNFTFVPYVIVIALLLGMAGLAIWFGTRTKEPSTASPSGPTAGKP